MLSCTMSSTSTRLYVLLASIGDVRPLIDGRPAARLERYFPPMVGEIPAGVLPADWLPARTSA
jgi:hypothetical protein